MTDAELEKRTRHIGAFASIIARAAHTSFEQHLNGSELGVSPVQFGVMRTLCHGNLTISELSRKFAVDPSTLVPVIDSLERKGYVLRSRDPQDRRRIPLSLTQEGQRLLRRSIPVNEDDAFVQAVSAIGPERGEQLIKLLTLLLSKMPDGDTIVREVVDRLENTSGTEAGNENETGPCHAHGHGHEQQHLIMRRKMMRKGRA